MLQEMTALPIGTKEIAPGKFENKVVQKKVWIPQLTVTLAKILNIQKPTASTFKVLPGIVS